MEKICLQQEDKICQSTDTLCSQLLVDAHSQKQVKNSSQSKMEVKAFQSQFFKFCQRFYIVQHNSTSKSI